MSFYESSRGGRKLVVDGYVFRQNWKDKENSRIRWKCEGPNKCGGTATTISDSLVAFREPDHIPKPDIAVKGESRA